MITAKKAIRYLVILLQSLQQSIFQPESKKTQLQQLTILLLLNLKMKIVPLFPFVNWLSDHDAQILTLNNINIQNPTDYTQTIRKIINTLLWNF